jgi:hypothetical protein
MTRDILLPALWDRQHKVGDLLVVQTNFFKPVEIKKVVTMQYCMLTLRLSSDRVFPIGRGYDKGAYPLVNILLSVNVLDANSSYFRMQIVDSCGANNFASTLKLYLHPDTFVWADVRAEMSMLLPSNRQIKLLPTAFCALP